MPTRRGSTETASRESRAPERRGARVSMALGLGALLVLLALGTIGLHEGSAGSASPGTSEPGVRALLARMQELLGLRARALSAGASESAAPGHRTAVADGAPSSNDDRVRGTAATQTAPSALGISPSLSPVPSADTGRTAGNGPSSADEAPRDARVSGRVVDATGGPIPGAKVSLQFHELALARYQKTGKLPVSRAPDAEWRADEEGRFEGLTPAGRLSLVASAEAYTEARVVTLAPVRDVLLVLAPGASVAGRVQRTDGSPVIGATLQLRPRGHEHVPIEGRSDERGEFSSPASLPYTSGCASRSPRLPRRSFSHSRRRTPFMAWCGLRTIHRARVAS
jgi:hypothetical protein